MDVQALISAAQGGDPKAAQFLQQLLAGGAGRGGGGAFMEDIKPVQPVQVQGGGNLPYGWASKSPLDSYDQAATLMDELLGNKGKDQTGMVPPGPQQVAPQAPPPGGLPGILPPEGPPQEQTLMSWLGGLFGGGR